MFMDNSTPYFIWRTEYTEQKNLEIYGHALRREVTKYMKEN